MRVVTFYSYKGGVGRTLALINVAACLARMGKRVLIVDFDLEAPGFDAMAGLSFKAGRGLVDLVHDYLAEGQVPDVAEYVVEARGSWPPFRARRGEIATEGRLLVLPAGDRSDEAAYKRRLNEIDFADLYKKRDGFLLFADLRSQWETQLQCDYVLVDSRTGHTDIGGICTRQLPDHVVMFLYPNEQNLKGVVSTAKEIRADACEIELDAVISRVPFLDDYERKIKKFEWRTRKALGVPQVLRVHSYDSIRLVADEVFCASAGYDETRLSKEYISIVRAIFGRNTGDRSAVLETLRPGMIRVKRTVGRDRSDQWVRAVGDLHRGDAEVLAVLSEALRRDGRHDQSKLYEGMAQRIHESGEPATALKLAELAEGDDPVRAAQLAVQAVEAGDSLDRDRRLDAFAMLCRIAPECADRLAPLAMNMRHGLAAARRHATSLLRTLGGVRVLADIMERDNVRPRLEPLLDRVRIVQRAHGEWNYGLRGEWEPSELLLALALALDAKISAEMEQSFLRLYGQKVNPLPHRLHTWLHPENWCRGCDEEELPGFPYETFGQFGLWLRLYRDQRIESTPGRWVVVVGNPDGLGAHREHGTGLPEGASVGARAMPALADLMFGDTAAASRLVEEIETELGDGNGGILPTALEFNCWRMLLRPAQELRDDLVELIRLRESQATSQAEGQPLPILSPPFGERRNR